MKRNSTTVFIESTNAITPVPWVNDAPDFSGFSGQTLSILVAAWTAFTGELEIIPDSSPSLDLPATIYVDNNKLVVDNSQVVQPISSTALPLPNGAATSSNQEAIASLLAPPITVTPNNLTDFFPISAFGEPETVTPFPLVQVDFVYGINSKLGITESFGTGTVSKDTNNPHMVLSTGASANSWAKYRTKRYLKYRSGQGLTIKYSSKFSQGAAGSVQVSGVFYVENRSNVPVIIDGYGYGFNGTSFGILHANNETLTWTPQTQFNFDKLDGTGPSGMNLDPTKFNLYQVKYPFLGVGSVFFYVEKPEGGLILTHVIQYPNNNTVAQLNNPNLPILSLVYNSTNTSNIVLEEITKSGFISGQRRPLGPKRCFDRVMSLSGTDELFMTSIRCNSTINSLTNRSQLHFKRISGANSGNSAVVMRFYKVSTLADSSFTNFDSVNSIAAYSDTGTYTPNANDLTHVLNLGAQTNSLEDVEDFDLFLEPSEILVITAQGRFNGQVPQISLIWVEDI